MNSTKEILSPTRVRLTVVVTPEDMQPAIDKAFKSIASSVNIPGFRRGKVPARIIEQRFGRAAVLEEAINEALPAAYEQAVAEQGLDTLSQPQLKIEQDLTEIGPDDDLTFVAEVDVRPEIVLPDYHGMSVQVADAEVTDDDVEASMRELRGRFASVSPVDRAAADGDMVVVDVTGTIDGEVVDEFTGHGMTFEVGAGNMIAGFDEAVRGLSEGESASFTYTSEEGEFAGREAELTVVVKGVRERELPAEDDDFAALASEFDTIDELRDDLRTRLARVKLVDQGIEARDKLAEELLATVEVPVPEGVLAQMLEQHFTDGHGDDEHRAEFEADARKSLRSQFLLDAIAEAEGITVEQDDLGQWIVQQAPRYNMTPDQFIQALVQADQISSAYGDVRRGKALTVVLESAEITDASGRKVDLTALDEDDEVADEVAEIDEVTISEDADGTVVVDEVVVTEDADGNIEIDETVVTEDADGNIEIDEIVVTEDAAGNVEVAEADVVIPAEDTERR